jgi:carboxypeptidase C (cathepsin A)
MRRIHVDTAIVSTHSRGDRRPARAVPGTVAGTQPVWDARRPKPIASVFYTYYERSDVRDRARRPLVISFNGGPGSASVWMHIGYTGPEAAEHRRRGLSRCSPSAFATTRTRSSMSPTSSSSIP